MNICRPGPSCFMLISKNTIHHISWTYTLDFSSEMGSLFIVISLCVCIIVVNRCMFVKTFTVSDTIMESKTFYYRQLSKYPSTTVTIEISLSNVGWNQILNFYLFVNNGFKIAPLETTSQFS